MTHVQWRATQNASALFRQLRDQMDHPEPAYEEMLGIAADAQWAWFQSEGRGWQALSPKYKRWKESLSPGRKIMHGPDLVPEPPKRKKDGTWTQGRAHYHEGGALRDDLTRNSRTNHGKFGIEVVRKSGFTFGTRIGYAEMHNEGEGKLPKRRLIAPMGGSTMREFESALLRHLMPAPSTSAAPMTTKLTKTSGQRSQPRRQSRAKRKGRR